MQKLRSPGGLASQKGAVLVFSLLILLVITIVGVGMVQQNRTQFMMAENTQMQTMGFSEAENILRSAENYIASQRYVTWPLPDPIPEECASQPCAAYACQTPGGIFQQLLPGDLSGGAVLANKYLPSDLGSRVEITRTVCLSYPPLGQQTEDCSNPSLFSCAHDETDDPGGNLCHTELYSITATVIDEANNRRVVESSYAVRCDN